MITERILRGIKRTSGIAPIVRKRALAEWNSSRLFQCVAECVFRGIGFRKVARNAFGDEERAVRAWHTARDGHLRLFHGVPRHHVLDALAIGRGRYKIVAPVDR